MTPESKNEFRKYKKKVLNPVTGTKVFRNDQEVLDAAIEQLHQGLKKKKLI